MIMEHPIVGNTRLIRRETSLDITFLVVLRPNVQGVRKNCVSCKNFHYFANFSLEALDCNWLKLESFENLLQRYIREGWVALDNEKTIFFLEHLLVEKVNS